MLNGEMGEAVAKAMKVVVKVAEALDASRLIRIEHAHISGVSYKNIGDSGLRLLKQMAELGARVSVPSTVNPAGMDLDRWREMGVSESFARKQLEIIVTLEKMGFKTTMTCTPYLYEKVKRGSQVAWAESNAVLYANSVCGLYTNREGGPLALMEAIVGRAPLVGYRLKENRAVTTIVDVSSIRKELDRLQLYPLLGYYIGLSVGQGVPLIVGLRAPLSVSNLKLMLAAIGTSGSLALVELRKTHTHEHAERITISSVKELLTHSPAELSDEGTVMMGCPHLSPGELTYIARIAAKYGKPRRRVVLFTARAAERYSPRAVNILKARGFEIYRDTCMVVSDLRSMGVDKVLVDSAKAAYYLLSQGYDVGMFLRKDLKEILYGGR